MAIPKNKGLRAHQTDTESDIEARRELAAVLAEVNEPEVMERLFGELFTRAELHALLLRWRLLKKLHAGMPQRGIAEQLGISLCKITRGSRVLKAPDAVIAKILDRIAAPKEK